MISVPDQMFIRRVTEHGLEGQSDFDRAAKLATGLVEDTFVSFEGAPTVTFERIKTVDLSPGSHSLSVARVGLIELQRGDRTAHEDDSDAFALTVTSGPEGAQETTLIVPNDARAGLVVPAENKILVGLLDREGAPSTLAIARRAKIQPKTVGRSPGRDFGPNIEVKADPNNGESIYLQPGFFEPDFDTTILTDTFDVVAAVDTIVPDLDYAISGKEGSNVVTALRVAAGIHTAIQKTYYR